MKAVIGILTVLILITGLCACTEQPIDLGEVQGVYFERGNGSVWGNHFLMDMDAGKVNNLAYFPVPYEDYVTQNNLPLNDEQWAAVKEAALNAASSMEVKKEPSFIKKLIEKHSQSIIIDGTDYYIFSISYENATVEYLWSSTNQGYALEQLLENTAREIG